MAESLGIVVVGAGVIGAAVAWSLRTVDLPVYVLEAEAQPGTGISSRNSGVIHAGIYYPESSLKERLCREGAAMLYDFAHKNGVPFLKTGKYIVANSDEECDHLNWLTEKNKGRVPLHWVDEIPAGIEARRAVFSPQTGIVDIHPLIETLLNQSGADVLYQQKVTYMETGQKDARLEVAGETVDAEWVINCAGLNATDFHGKERHYLARGAYFRLKCPQGLELPHLVYPAVPKHSPALGIHLTRNMAGEAYLGPDLEWIDELSYAVDEKRASEFFNAARRYLPWLKEEHLSPGYAGVRPKLSPTHWSDFLIERTGRLIHCLGIESPGLTAALAIGKMVADLVIDGSDHGITLA
ncbi:MAG: FAD-dependent oxidoreductase [Acidobacteriota bacterium]|nr:FAD-dependent oxidoreductase [Acidobacteriota bacterium]